MILLELDEPLVGKVELSVTENLMHRLVVNNFVDINRLVNHGGLQNVYFSLYC